MDPEQLARVIFHLKKLEEEDKKQKRAAAAAEREQEEEDVEMGQEAEEKKNPRWNGRWFYLTYARTKDTSMEDVMQELSERMDISEYHI